MNDINNPGRHDFIGRSAGRGAFLIWTHHLQDILYNSTFVPRGAPASENYDGKSFVEGDVIIILTCLKPLPSELEFYGTMRIML
jgi:hypothetical protein